MEERDERRDDIRRDLADLAIFRKYLEPKGFRGIVYYCADCDEDHYVSWDLLRDNLEFTLETGETRVHEPAHEPDPALYVSWEYARGYADGVEDSRRAEAERRLKESRRAGGRPLCAFCGERLPEGGYEAWNYCPRCGESLAPVRLATYLYHRGWPARSIEELLARAGFKETILALPLVALHEEGRRPLPVKGASKGKRKRSQA